MEGDETFLEGDGSAAQTQAETLANARAKVSYVTHSPLRLSSSGRSTPARCGSPAVRSHDARRRSATGSEAALSEEASLASNDAMEPILSGPPPPEHGERNPCMQL